MAAGWAATDDDTCSQFIGLLGLHMAQGHHEQVMPHLKSALAPTQPVVSHICSEFIGSNYGSRVAL